MGIQNILFILVLLVAIYFFVVSLKRISQNIKRGRNKEISDSKPRRWNTMFRVAFGQSKMMVKPIPGILHFIIYASFILINIEVVEILIDGIFGTHRILSFAGGFYNFLIAFFEILAFLSLIAALAFLWRRNVMNISRFKSPDLKGWPFLDANIILFFELVLMSAIILMNASDLKLQNLDAPGFHHVGYFPVAQYLVGFLPDNISTLLIIERTTWWIHIIGILIFLNYIPFSKHLHLFLAFPNTYYSNLSPLGKLDNLQSVTDEVKLMLDPNADPFAAPAPDANAEPVKFGVEDVSDLSWKNLLDGYTCSECGRCTAMCPANLTGKKLSPREILMSVRDRTEVWGKSFKNENKEEPDKKVLLDNYISQEELWACNTCNACTDACPINIDPLKVILDMRRFLVLEQSKIPAELATMFNNIENNGAPWQFSQADRLNWRDES